MMKIEELLAYSLDNTLNDIEQMRLDEALASSDELQQMRDELIAMRDLLKGQQVEARSDFREGVMMQLQLPDGKIKELAFRTRVLRLFPRVAAACLVLMSLTYVGMDSRDTLWLSDELMGTESISPEDAYTYLSMDDLLN